MACQTDVSEIPEVRILQMRLQAVRDELVTVNQELQSTEQRLRHEMQREMDARLRMLGERCTQKVAFVRQQAERHMSSVRAASKMNMTRKLAAADRTMHLELAAKATAEQKARGQTGQSKKEYESLYSLATGYARENLSLHRLLKELQSRPASMSSPRNSSPRALSAALDTSGLASDVGSAPAVDAARRAEASAESRRFELTLAARDATIVSLRGEVERLLTEYVQTGEAALWEHPVLEHIANDKAKRASLDSRGPVEGGAAVDGERIRAPELEVPTEGSAGKAVGGGGSAPDFVPAPLLMLPMQGVPPPSLQSSRSMPAAFAAPTWDEE